MIVGVCYSNMDVELLKAEGQFAWTDGPFRGPQVMRREEESNPNPEARKLTKMSMLITATVWMRTPFVDKIKEFKYYSIAFKL